MQALLSTIWALIAVYNTYAYIESFNAFGERCYGELGCLNITSNWYGKYRPFNVFPQNRSEINTRFLLNSKENPNVEMATEIRAELSTILESAFESSRPTKIIVHGWLDSGESSWIKDMTSALLDYGDFNVIRVDYSGGSITLRVIAAANTRLVGLEIGHLVNFLISEMGVSPEEVHCIGHSLGSQACGYAGEQIQGLGRITGLDPSFFYFYQMPNFVRLDTTDALFVDIIQTDRWDNLKTPLGLGTPDAIGNINFRPNSGRFQPGCNPITGISADLLNSLELLYKENVQTYISMVTSLKNIISCSHYRAVEYFTDSLRKNDCLFVGQECPNYQSFERGECNFCGEDDTACAILGIRADEYVNKSRKGAVLYLDTDFNPPYCRKEATLNFLNQCHGVYHYHIILLTTNPQEEQSSVSGKVNFVLRGNVASRFNGDQRTIIQGNPVTFLFTSEVNLGKLLKIEIEWLLPKSLLNVFQPITCIFGWKCSSSLYVQRVEITPLFNIPQSNRDANSTIVCGENGKPVEIRRGETIALVASELCG